MDFDNEDQAALDPTRPKALDITDMSMLMDVDSHLGRTGQMLPENVGTKHNAPLTPEQLKEIEKIPLLPQGKIFQCGNDEAGAGAPIVAEQQRPAPADVVDSFVAGVLDKLEKRGIKTEHCDGDDDPETILANWIADQIEVEREQRKKMISVALKAGRGIGRAAAQMEVIDKEEWSKIFRDQLDEMGKENARLYKAAKNVVEMLPLGPDRYELEAALDDGGSDAETE